jgi:hypothetical protein
MIQRKIKLLRKRVGLLSFILLLSGCTPPAYYLADITEEIHDIEYTGIEDVEISIERNVDENQGYSLYHGRTLVLANHSSYIIRTSDAYRIYHWNERWLLKNHWEEEETPAFTEEEVLIEPGETAEFLIETQLLDLTDRILWIREHNEVYYVAKEFQFIDDAGEIVSEEEIKIQFRLTSNTNYAD